MTDLSNPADVRFLLKKLWCHGQLVAPVQAGAYSYWAVAATDAQVLFAERVLLIVSAAVLPLWSYVSWTRMKRQGLHAVHTILWLGGFIEVLHTVVCVVAAQKLDNLANKVIFIVTLLHVVETFMYLFAVYCLQFAIIEDMTPESEQSTLIGLDAAPSDLAKVV